MLNQAYDFLEECNKLYGILENLDDDEFQHPTLFKGWTINDILRHLHAWNHAVSLSITSEPELQEFLKESRSASNEGDIRTFEAGKFPDLEGKRLLEEWKQYCKETSDLFAKQDPKTRLKWAGPDMSALSSITARLMETWSHAQAIYDLLGIDRVSEDYIKNIVILGINTFGWSYKVNGMEVPGEVPHIRLHAPSGEVWEWNDPGGGNTIEGSAVEFCQTVTQARNIADTGLKVDGPIAKQWMSIAQCFAGPPRKPPPKGERRSSK